MITKFIAYLATYVVLYPSMTVPDNVTGVMLICEVDVLVNQCTVDWDVSDCVTLL